MFEASDSEEMCDFDRLQPQMILDAVERAGFLPTGEYTQLNSYENRVFDLRLEEGHAERSRVIAKFYRPHRWTREAIEDEHRFLADLHGEGIPAITALELATRTCVKARTTLDYDGFIMALFPRVAGRMPDEFLPGQLKQVGRTLARIHNVGARRWADNRLTLSAEDYGWPALDRLQNFVYPELWSRYRDVASDILEFIESELDSRSFVRIHGDCHKGNLLLQDSAGHREFFFVDFDDFCNGPVVQDFWMLLSGPLEDDEVRREFDELCDGYSELRDLPDEWHWIEPLRGLRIIHYSGWIAQRWQDPFFKRVFPSFTTYNHWLDELSRLEKIARAL